MVDSECPFMATVAPARGALLCPSTTFPPIVPDCAFAAFKKPISTKKQNNFFISVNTGGFFIWD
jgi:hypothetical protein